MFGATVVLYRQRVGMTQEELADRTGLGVRTIRELESGRVRRPRPATVRLLADAFELQGEARDRFQAGAAAATEPAELAEPGPSAAIPARLPASTFAFTGRVHEMEWLDQVAQPEESAAVSTLAPIVICGAAGVGKTALAVAWAHRVRGHFPDGQLFLNLRGYAAASPLSACQAISRVLTALGVSSERIPADEEEAAGLLRDTIADRRMLMVLDNAHHPDQVRPLLPAGAGCLAIITTRSRFSGLVAVDGARRITLERLAAQEATSLLRRLLDDGRAEAEPQALEALAEACDKLPLALRIAAANLADEPHRSIGEYVARLADGRAGKLAALRVVGDDHAAVGAAFSLSYRRLEPRAQRLFRLLGLDPSVDTTPAAAAALAALAPADAEQLLDVLADAHLLEQTAADRLSCHDLIRLYARECALQEEPEAEIRAALQRLLDFYLQRVDAAARELYPHVLRLPYPEEPAAPFADHGAALTWLDEERSNLVATVAYAAEHGPRRAAWMLADAMRGYFGNRMHLPDWIATAQAARAAAQAENEVQAEASAELSFGLMHWRRGSHQEAIESYTRALTHAERAGWVQAQAAALGNLGAAWATIGRLDEGVSHYRKAYDLHLQTGRLPGQAAALGNLGVIQLELGQLAQAEENIRAAIDLYEQLGSPAAKAIALNNLGDVCYLMGRGQEALEALTSALALHREAGNLGNEADTLATLALVHSDADRPEHALELATAALDRALDSNHRHYQGVSLTAIASITLRMGDHARAVEHYQAALDLALLIDHRYVQTQALLGLARARRHAAHLDQAAADATQALTLARTVGFRLLEACALTTLAEIQLDLGHQDEAADTAQAALALHLLTGHRPGAARTRPLLHHP